jgi:hypothetical protein
MNWLWFGLPWFLAGCVVAPLVGMCIRVGSGEVVQRQRWDA